MSGYELEDYVLCHSHDADDFNNKLKALIEKGYAPYGAPHFSITKNSCGEDMHFMQPMGKHKKVNDYDIALRELQTKTFVRQASYNPKMEVMAIVEQAINRKMTDNIQKCIDEASKSDIPRQSFGGVDGKPKD